MTPRSLLIPASILALAASLGCKSKPSEAFLEQVKDTVRLKEGPGFDIAMALPMEGQPFKQAELRDLAEVLANKLGFRIEASQARKGFLPVTNYAFQDFKAPDLPGLTFRKNGDTVAIRADFQWEMVVETALPPKEGFLATQGQDAKTKAEAFEKAVEKISKDGGFKRAWLVSYRQKPKSTLPQDSPFWALCDAWLKTSKVSGVSIMPNTELVVLDETAQWVKRHGQLEVKDSLAIYNVVAFEGQDGKLAKTEGWKAFLAE